MRQKTISDAVTLRGINVFNGQRNSVRFEPAEDNSGIVFVAYNRFEIKATLDNAFHVSPCRKYRYASTVGLHNNGERNGMQIIKIEHLIASMRMLGIDNVRIILSDDVVPRFPWGQTKVIEALESLVIDSESAINQLAPPTNHFHQEIGMDSFTAVYIPDVLRLTYIAGYPHKAIGEQKLTVDLDLDTYKKRIMDTRPPFFLLLGSKILTFAACTAVSILDGTYRLGQQPHGSYDFNTLYIGGKSRTKFVNPRQQKYSRSPEYEFVEHKVMDAICPLALFESQYHTRFANAHFIYHKTGHRTDLEFWRLFSRVLEQQDVSRQ